jgi:hypothetical protein
VSLLEGISGDILEQGPSLCKILDLLANDIYSTIVGGVQLGEARRQLDPNRTSEK